jgi:small-conductance mechanosensitive channel
VVTDANVQVIIPNGSVWGQPIKNMSTSAAPAALAAMPELRMSVPAGMALDEAQRRIVAIVKATPKVLPSPAPMLLQN